MCLHGVPPLCPCPEGINPALLEPDLQPAAVQLYREGGRRWRHCTS